MDRNFHTDDFERLLREKSDEFRMYPSKRIWHSIYNNIHPGRKWPSVAMSIMLISALLLMGYLNTKNTNLYPVTGKQELQQNLAVQSKSSQFISRDRTNNNVNTTEIPLAIVNSKKDALPQNKLTGNDANKTAAKSPMANAQPRFEKPVVLKNISVTNDPVNLPNNINKIAVKTNIVSVSSSTGEKTGNEISSLNITPGDGQYEGLFYSQKTAVNDYIKYTLTNDFAGPDNKPTVTLPIEISIAEKNNLAINTKEFVSAEEKDWIENYALYNRPATKKWANKLSWELYGTPSVVYRMLFNDPGFENSLNTTPLAISTSNQDVNKSVIQKPSFGIEIGSGILYAVSKRVKLKAGFQINYTRYNSEAFQNSHPVATRLTMHDYNTNTSYEEIRNTPFSNKTGLESVKLHNETFQLSMPVGAEMKLIGNDNLQWNFGVTIQPTYVPTGKSYLISSDRRNYIKETSRLNKWNLNAGFETFLSYKAASGIVLQLGPQFRTQLFSTNIKQIAVEERLLNYGLKFGISKTIK